MNNRQKDPAGPEQTLSDEVITTELIQHLDLTTRSRLARASKNLYCLFGHTADNATRLLQLVAHGEREKAKAMIQNNPDILLEKRNLTDWAERTFSQITPFQYALWACDLKTLEILRQSLPNQDALAQLNEHLSTTNAPRYVKLHGRHFSFEPIKAAYQAYLALKSKQKIMTHKQSKQLNDCWLDIGKKQGDCPTHFLREYFSPEYTFFAIPTARLTGLGTKFTLVYGNRAYPFFWETPRDGSFPHSDHLAISNREEKQSKALQQFIQTLQNQPNQYITPSLSNEAK